jgi:hypothetical protein
MKQQMYAELMFDHPSGRDRAVAELSKRGFDVEVLDWVDEYEGVLLTPTVWIKVRGASELDENEFFREMQHLAEQFSGEVVEAGLQFPPPAASTIGASAQMRGAPFRFSSL